MNNYNHKVPKEEQLLNAICFVLKSILSWHTAWFSGNKACILKYIFLEIISSMDWMKLASSTVPPVIYCQICHKFVSFSQQDQAPTRTKSEFSSYWIWLASKFSHPLTAVRSIWRSELNILDYYLDFITIRIS